MSFTVMRRPLPFVTAFGAPAIAVILAAGGITASILLQQHASAHHTDQLRIAAAAALLDDVQGIAWQQPRSAADASAIRIRLRSDEVRLLTEAVAERSPVLSRDLRANFRTLETISAAMEQNGPPDELNRLAVREGKTLLAPHAELTAAAAKARQAADAASRNAMLGSAAVIVALFGAFGYFYVRSQRGAAQQRRSHAELTVAHDRLARVQEERMRLLSRTVEGAEDERRRIAADLHDGPIQRLTAAAFTLDLLASRLARGERNILGLVEQIREQLAGEMRALRRVMAELRPPVLDEGGVAAAIRHSAEEILPPSMQCTVHDRTNAGRFIPEVETIVYRVAREALVNVQKHANARAVTVDVELAGELLSVAVSDDGDGFDQTEVASYPAGSHIGLVAMRERVESIGGELRIASAPGLGTRIEAVLPYSPAGSSELAAEESRAAAA
jgi:signal transduction histidine kinase